MHAVTLLLLILGAGALAQPSSSLPKLPRGTDRIGHTAWIASYGVDDNECSGPWLNGTDGDSDVTRPTLTWNRESEAISKKFTVVKNTNNVGIYFGSHKNHVNFVYLYIDNKVLISQVNATRDGHVACISASSNGY